MIDTSAKPEIVKKGWGEEVIIVNNDEYCGKILKINAGHEFSFHFHKLKLETFYVLKGIAALKYLDLATGEELQATLQKGDIVHIPRCEPHQISADFDTEIIEFSTHHEDSDSYRIAKGDSQR